MNYHTIIGLFLLVFLLQPACRNSSGLTFAERQEFKKVYIDITLANSAVESYPIAYRDSMREIYYKQVFDLHKIDLIQYNKYVDKLEEHPIQAKEIYQSVLDSLKIVKNKHIEKSEEMEKNSN